MSATDYTGGVKIEGTDKVLRELEKLGPKVLKAARLGLQKGGLNIIADAQENLRANGSVVTGLLRQSGKVQQTNDTTLEVGFFDTQNKRGGYAAFVESGRKPGKMPPPDEMAAYAKKKLRISDPRTAASAGWAMAKKIAREGTKAHPFFLPAVKRNQKRILADVQEALTKEL